MNPLFRKAALIAASLGLLVSLYFALNPGDEEETAATTTVAETTPQTTTTAPATTEPEPDPPPATTGGPAPAGPVRVTITVGAEGVDSVRRLSVKRGREVVLVVRSELADHVHLHGYDLMADVAPGAPATIRFTASAPGRFEIELEDRGLPIGDLEVRP